MFRVYLIAGVLCLAVAFITATHAVIRAAGRGGPSRGRWRAVAGHAGLLAATGGAAAVLLLVAYPAGERAARLEYACQYVRSEFPGRTGGPADDLELIPAGEDAYRGTARRGAAIWDIEVVVARQQFRPYQTWSWSARERLPDRQPQ